MLLLEAFKILGRVLFSFVAVIFSLPKEVRVDDGKLIVGEGLTHDPHIVLQSQVLME